MSPLLNHNKQILKIIFAEDPLLGFIETKCSSATKCCRDVLALRNPICVMPSCVVRFVSVKILEDLISHHSMTVTKGWAGFNFFRQSWLNFSYINSSTNCHNQMDETSYKWVGKPAFFHSTTFGIGFNCILGNKAVVVIFLLFFFFLLILATTRWRIKD